MSKSLRKSLSPTGLSLSQAQSISNLCHQESREIENKISIINNCSKKLEYNEKTLEHSVGYPMPTDIIELLTRKGKLHALQAFLMENIKCKDTLLHDTKTKMFQTTLKLPSTPQLQVFVPEKLVDDSYGLSKLTTAEYNEFLEHEAMASHIGQFIHKNGKLDILRRELPTISPLEWMEINNTTKTPVIVKTHHTSDELLTIHNNLAMLHRKHEQKVNYFKAKIKNITTEKNAEISKSNADKQNIINNENSKTLNEHKNEVAIINDKILVEQQKFEEERQNEIKEISALRILVDTRFTEMVNSFSETLKD